ncbi:MAG: DNA-formamidopyrimidine glycosylase, partial [Pleurocapsa sp. SU_196_0]|nr:DNA-formamidopyrimidine glycosylase [Pleurocapsa sp. SU_196_0]
LGENFDLETFHGSNGEGLQGQTRVAVAETRRGVGNIYADEALFRARIHPEASRLTKTQAKRLHAAIREVMTRAVEVGGSTLSDNSYQQPNGEPGYFKLEHAVYDRAGQPCVRCGTPIEKYFLAQRGTHYCPRCQTS